MSVHFADNQFHIEEKILDDWREVFFLVDVAAEIDKARMWYIANPNKQKKDHKRFLANWMRRCQDKAPKPKEQRVIEQCNHCHECGVIVHNKLAWKCKCSNGDRVSQEFLLAPDEAFLPPKPLMDQLVALPDPTSTFKGFASTCFLLKGKNPERYAEVRRFFIDTFGAKEATKIFNETEKIDIAFGRE